MSLVRPAIVAILLALGAGAIVWHWWMALLMLLPFAWFIGFVSARSLHPTLKIGPLTADLQHTIFGLRVENMGPGDATPKVVITNLTDGEWTALEGAYSNCEAHWRGAAAGTRPLLGEGDDWYSGPLFLPYVNTTDSPRLHLYPLDHKIRPLWGQNHPPKNGIRFTLAISCQAKEGEPFKLQSLRTYHLTLDKNAPLKYKVKRLWFQSWGVKQQAIPATSTHDSSSLTP
jgi:hypothetical protein